MGCRQWDKVLRQDYEPVGLVSAAPMSGDWFHQHFGVRLHREPPCDRLIGDRLEQRCPDSIQEAVGHGVDENALAEHPHGVARRQSLRSRRGHGVGGGRRRRLYSRLRRQYDAAFLTGFRDSVGTDSREFMGSTCT
jgi:hypothetical protein